MMVCIARSLGFLASVSVVLSSSLAQPLDPFELGRIKGGAVAHAVWLDHYARTCENDRTPRHWNLVDNVLRAQWRHGAEEVVENAARMTGTTPEEAKAHTVKQLKDKKRQLGGCKSQRMKAWIEEVKTSFSNHVHLLTKAR